MRNCEDLYVDLCWFMRIYHDLSQICWVDLLHFPTTWWWVVDMMMWLTWWCGWHDGGNADHMTIVHKLRSFLTKLPLTMATCRTPLSGTRTCDIIPQEHMLTLSTESSSSLPSILVVVWPQGSVILGHLGTLKIMELVNYHNSRTQYKETGLYMAILGSHISFRFILLVIGFQKDFYWPVPSSLLDPCHFV